MVSFSELDLDTKKKIMGIWKEMNETEKVHFVNQVALALSIWGSETTGKKKIVDILHYLLDDGSKNLSDFGIYISKTLKMGEKERRANKIIERYRLKHNLSAEPHKPLF
ncbi:hypothetical protein JXB01_03335 [Candidatus Micrarchaeota archaeon]|nr:hypothetical protein [Candidatus Micrarchaeota archaeon]